MLGVKRGGTNWKVAAPLNGSQLFQFSTSAADSLDDLEEKKTIPLQKITYLALHSQPAVRFSPSLLLVLISFGSPSDHMFHNKANVRSDFNTSLMSGWVCCLWPKRIAVSKMQQMLFWFLTVLHNTRPLTDHILSWVAPGLRCEHYGRCVKRFYIGKVSRGGLTHSHRCLWCLALVHWPVLSHPLPDYPGREQSTEGWRRENSKDTFYHSKVRRKLQLW